MLKGILYSLTASFLFGYLYYFSTLLRPLGGEDIFGYRIVLTIPFVIAAIVLLKQQKSFIHQLRRIRRQPVLLLIYIINSSIIGFQMWLFLWAPNHGSALSVSAGYLLLPLVLVLIARVVYKEHLSRLKLIAVCIAAIGVTSSIALKGGLSWESMVICLGYTLYFSLRRSLKLANLAAFAIEMLLQLPVCIYFAWQVDLTSMLAINSRLPYLLPLLGLISGVALITYVLASTLLPMNLLGLLGYTETILMVVVAFIIGERIDSGNYPLFICLSIGMLLIILDGLLKIKWHKVR